VVPSYYQRVAGSSLERLAALSDGIFAVAMTLLVLDLRVPAIAVFGGQHPLWSAGAVSHEGALLHALGHLAPRLLAYFMSFVTLGIFWIGQQAQLHQFERSDHRLTWIHLTFLLAVSLMPFSTALLAEFITYRGALLVYWLNLLLLGIVLWASLRYAARAGLLKADGSAEMRSAAERRIVVYQMLYAMAVVFCVISTYVSTALLVLLQLNSVLAPKIRPLDRF
jgi:uncharacterized membrane protein